MAATDKTLGSSVGLYPAGTVSGSGRDVSVLFAHGLYAARPRGGMPTLAVFAEGRNGRFSVSGVPFLSGGTARPSELISAAYLNAENIGDTHASLTGFELTESGSALDTVITGFETSDNLGGSRQRLGGVGFRSGKAFIPLQATLAAGEVRIFTIQARISQNSGLYAGNTLQSMTTGIDNRA